MSAPLLITGLGAVTPVGLTAAQTCAAIRAGLDGFSVNGCVNRSKGPTLRAEIPIRPRPRDTRSFGRLVALASVALKECALSAGLEAERYAVLLAVREPYRSRGEQAWRDASLLEAIQSQLAATFGPGSQALPFGNAAFFLGLSRARHLLTTGQTDVCVVGGVDSLLNSSDARLFGNMYRLKSDDVAQGFVPGEGAAFVAVRMSSKTAPLAVIRGVGLAEEDTATSALSDASPSGIGMAKAMRAALEDAQMSEAAVDFRASDMNGEMYRGHDALLSTSRVYRTRREEFPHLIPAASVGETGAASGALVTVVAATAVSRGYAPGKLCMCEASSDGGLRGAGLIG